MKQPAVFIMIPIIVFQMTSLLNAQIPVTSRSTNLYEDWKFIKQDAANAQSPTFDDAGWRTLDLPHDWSIEGKFSQSESSGDASAFLPTGVGWYRKSFSITGDLSEKKVFICFEGVYHKSKVYINGELLGERFYGYSPLVYDLTPYIKASGENIIAVRVDNSDQINSRWYTGSGIYRDVWLLVTDKLHVAQWGTTITTPKAAASADIRVATKIKNEYTTPRAVTLETTLQTENGTVLTRDTASQEIPAGGQYEFTQDFSSVPVSLWSPETPVLYQAVSRVLSAQRLNDSLMSPFGVRKIEFTKDKGLLLNGNVVKMKGVNIHHDLGCLGAAFYERAMRRRLTIFKEMGINAIRTSHNPHAPGLIALCDRMGFLVIDEAFDKFASPYYPNFSQGWKKDLQDFIDRDKNHPCVIQWSVGNEVAENDGAILKEMVSFVHTYDPTRQASFSWSPHTLNSYFDGNANLKSQIPAMDVLNINYSEHLLERVRTSIPDKAMVMTEAFVFYRGNGTTIKAYYEQNPWLDVVKYDYLAGSFLWSGIDYLGEAIAGWPMHGWNGSPVDLTGYMRPVAYLHKSFMAKEPMVYLAVRHKDLEVPPTTKGHWDWPPLVDHWTLPKLEGQTVKVYAYTNYPTVELTVNGVSKGVKKLADFSDKMMYWEIPYEAGTIRADCGSAAQPVASCQLKTAGPAAKIVLFSDTSAIVANGKDVCHIRVEIQDTAGTLVPSAKNSITFDATGSGTLLALDNGNLQSTEPHQQTNKRDAFYGRALAVVKSGKTPGTISLTASAQGLTSGTVTIKTISEGSGSTGFNPAPQPFMKTDVRMRLLHYGNNILISIPGEGRHDISIVQANGIRIGAFSATTAATHGWNAAGAARGVYFIHARCGQEVLTKKVVLVR